MNNELHISTVSFCGSSDLLVSHRI